eukprot:364999-Chlamydomonas_euryale.AAC.11
MKVDDCHAGQCRARLALVAQHARPDAVAFLSQRLPLSGGVRNSTNPPPLLQRVGFRVAGSGATMGMPVRNKASVSNADGSGGMKCALPKRTPL